MQLLMMQKQAHSALRLERTGPRSTTWSGPDAGKRGKRGGLKHCLFSRIYGIIHPIDQYFSRWIKPPTRYFLIFPDVSHGQCTDNQFICSNVFLVQRTWIFWWKPPHPQWFVRRHWGQIRPGAAWQTRRGPTGCWRCGLSPLIAVRYSLW